MSSACLQIGNLLLTGEQIVSALARFNQLESFLGNVLLESMLESIPLSEEEQFFALTGESPERKPDQFKDFLARFLEEKKISREYFEWRICRELRLAKLKRVRFEKDVESEFLRRKSEFDQVKFSLIQTRDEILAQEIFFQIRDGESPFNVLAENFSEGNEKKTGGIVGPIKLSELPENIAQLFRVSPMKTVLQPLKVGSIFWVVQIEMLLEARLTEEVRNELRDRLFNDWLTKNVKALMADPEKIKLISATPTPVPPKLAAS